MEVSEAKRLKTLEDEKTRLKRLLADAMDNAALKDLLDGMYGAPRRTRCRDVVGDDFSCIKVSGLSRVDCRCGQAVMRSAHAVHALAP